MLTDLDGLPGIPKISMPKMGFGFSSDSQEVLAEANAPNVAPAPDISSTPNELVVVQEEEGSWLTSAECSEFDQALYSKTMLDFEMQLQISQQETKKIQTELDAVHAEVVDQSAAAQLFEKVFGE